ncbi:MAG: aldehyde:ferredoxin oxidoreductase [Desulfovibrio sp.]|nr:MAG: aldehyde:ferredoxin oxidoreductase [Desulfovibrio sp.]
MDTQQSGYHGVMLEVDLTTGNVQTIPTPAQDVDAFLGGRGLGIKMLWDRIPYPGLDPLSPDNPLIFLAGPFSGLPIASASRTCVMTKSPCTSAESSPYPHASTVSYSNFGGFFGPEIRFAGYDGIVITGKAPSPVYLHIDNSSVAVKSAESYWGMGTDDFDKKFSQDLGQGRFQTAYIGPAGENLVSFASIIHTASRAAGRGVGCVMGSKNLKAIAVRGDTIPSVAKDKQLAKEMESSRSFFSGLSTGTVLSYKFGDGTAFLLQDKSNAGVMTVKNFREGTFPDIGRINADAAREKLWERSIACYCCPLACKKSGLVKEGSYKGLIVHDGPEYETGVMFGANLMASDLGAIMKAIYDGDDLGMDIIAAGNVIGFLMEAYEKGHIDQAYLDGIDLAWGDMDAVTALLGKISRREGVGDLASKGVRALCQDIGEETKTYAMHAKGMEMAAHNVHANPGMGVCYATCTRGACHQFGESAFDQDLKAVIDSLGICRFATLPPLGLSLIELASLLSAITGTPWSASRLLRVGERIINLEKMFNVREGFGRQDDVLPERFFTEALTWGDEKGAVLDRDQFQGMMADYYTERGWDPETTRPSDDKLRELGLDGIVG